MTIKIIHYRNVDQEFQDNLTSEDELLRHDFVYSQIKDVEGRLYVILRKLNDVSFYIPLDIILKHHREKNNRVIPVYRNTNGLKSKKEEKAYIK